MVPHCSSDVSPLQNLLWNSHSEFRCGQGTSCLLVIVVLHVLSSPHALPCCFVFLRRMACSHSGAQRTVRRSRDYMELRAVSRSPVLLSAVISGRGPSALISGLRRGSPLSGCVREGQVCKVSCSTTHSLPAGRAHGLQVWLLTPASSISLWCSWSSCLDTGFLEGLVAYIHAPLSVFI